ncbi:MAG: hypothetical protein WB502_09645 [Thermoactinomyces sp.]
MSGPALERKHSHRSIHEGALREAGSLTDLLRRLYREKRERAVHEVTDALIEHWENRILAHAQVEEDGLYLRKAEAKTGTDTGNLYAEKRSLSDARTGGGD